MSQADLGAATGFSQAAISRLERGGGASHDVRTLRLVAAALAIPSSELGIAEPNEESDDVNRRKFLGLGAMAGFATAGSAAVQPVAAASAPRVGDADVAAVEQAVADVRDLDQLVGGDKLVRLATAQVDQVRRLLDSGSYTDPVGRRLTSALCEASINAGWVNFDAGQLGEAERFYNDAGAAAAAARNDLLLAYAYANASRLAFEAENPRLAVQFAQAGQRAAMRDGGPRLRALLHAREAEGFGQMRDPAAVRDAVRRARRAFDSSRGVDPQWVDFVTEAELAGLCGRAYRLAGAHNASIKHLQEAAAGMGDRPRNRACWELQLASALIEHGDAGAGCVLATNTLTTIADLSSTRVRRQLRGVVNSARQHVNINEARHFVAQATSSA